MGRPKRAAVPTPSLGDPPFDEPASVVTAPVATTIWRISSLFVSAT